MSNSMDITKETQAPSTDMGQQPPPIHPIPPLPNSPSPFAQSSQPSDTQIPNKSTVGRPILKPTAPSKRPTPDRTPQNSSEKTGIENAFLPKELREIIA
ncbi:hypothetical protein EPUL_005393, partial [Erysiphe pulchra]